MPIVTHLWQVPEVPIVTPQLTSTASSNTVTWQRWNWNYGSTAQTWTYWNTQATNTSTTWQYWTNGMNIPPPTGQTVGDTAHVWQVWTSAGQNPQFAPETPEQRAVREERNRARVAAQEAASQKAVELLESTLTATQARTRREQHRLTVHGSKGGVYEICPGKAGNVYRLDQNGRRVRKFCIHPTSDVPEADVHLAQKLMLETDEDMFVAIANASTP